MHAPNLAMCLLPIPLLLLSLSIRLGSGAFPAPPPTAPSQVQELPVSSTIPKYTTTYTTTIVVDDEPALAEAVIRRRQLRARRIKTEVAASAQNYNAILVLQERKLSVEPPMFHPRMEIIAAVSALFIAFLLIMMVGTNLSTRTGILPRRSHSTSLLPEYAPLSQRYQSPTRRHQVNTLHALTTEAAASADAPRALSSENDPLTLAINRAMIDSSLPPQNVPFEQYNDAEDIQVLTDVVDTYILHVRKRH